MAETHRLSSRIADRLARHQRDLSEQQKRIDGSMKELLEQRDRLSAVARRMMESVVHPRMEELIRHFDNAAIMDCHGDVDFHCVCKFAHTPRFPATVSLDLALLPGERHAELTARYELEILPVLMEYKRDEEATFPFDGSDEAVGLWVEGKIEQFLDAYLRLETHPLYQKDNLVTDPVCGMRISSIAATSKVEWPGHTIYFCSDVCRDAFLKEQK
ncbi:YHS domain-containing protein [Geobacter sp. DSM 9736]|uniref:YHS domain-containing protein n=1 Tax=Geobacter sp. DSM 9736 TaxID=1277350 RepID=UPI000B503187|nr:YHS domain-containing protein [Geobacter sp. DSM 9736]SNB45405.1 YHS domain-containing protein [Geobacter sp. DSM 9736]